MKRKQHCVVVTFAMLAFVSFLAGCDTKPKEAPRQQIEVSVVVTGRAIEGMETIYDGTQELLYRVDGRSVGQGDSGAVNLLSELEKVRETAIVRIVVPPRLVAGTGKAVRQDSHDLSQYIKDDKTAGMISHEFARIRGENRPSSRKN